MYRRDENNYRPSKGYVPDADTAIRIAEAVWMPIYGKDLLDTEKPFEASLSGDVWTVTGRLPEGMLFGGVAEIDIRKSNGQILRVNHGE